jgi:hypothetical protein
MVPRFVQVPPQRAREIRSTCAWLGYSTLVACIADGVLLVYCASRPQGSVSAGFLGGISLFCCFMAAFVLAYCRDSVPNGYLNLTDARTARRMPWVMWAFSAPTTGLSLLVLPFRDGGGWAAVVFALALVLPFLLTSVIGVRSVTLFQAPFYWGPAPPQAHTGNATPRAGRRPPGW